jgi:Arc/MetJ family transcription regulator
MATSNGLDDRLIEAAVKAGGHRTMKEAVTEALRLYVRNSQQLDVLELIGTIEYDSNYDHKAERRGC